MAATVAVTRMTVPGDRHLVEAVITGDASYATGGYAVTPSTFGLTQIIQAIIPAGTSAGTVAVWDSVNSKVLFIVQNTGAEVANATNVSARAVPVFVWGY